MRRKPLRASQYDCAIIGGGPGGLVSALYLSRFKRKVVVIDAGHSRAQWIPRIRNLIGYGSGLGGLTLLEKLRKQVNLYKVEWIHGEAQVHKSGLGFEVRVGPRKLTAQKVILATGMRDLQPPIPNVPELRRRGVLAYCPICDGYDHSDQVIGLLVKDNHGFKKLKFLSQFSKKLVAIQTEPFRISGSNQKLARQMGAVVLKGSIDFLKYQQRPRKGIAVTMKSGQCAFVQVAYVALGVDFNHKTTESLKKLRRNQDGFLITKGHQQTSIPGLYAVGDCVNSLAQVSVAIGQAAVASTHIHNTLGTTVSVS